MYLIFISALLLFLFQSTSPLDIAPNKETLKQSLIQIDQFLDKLEQSIRLDRNYLHKHETRRAHSSANTEKQASSNEEVAALFSNENLFRNAPIKEQETNINSDDIHKKAKNHDFKDVTFNPKKHPKFMMALASLDANKINTGSTKKLSNAVYDLKQLMNHDIEVKNDRYIAQATDDYLKLIKKELNVTNKHVLRENLTEKTAENKEVGVNVDKNEGKDDFDIFSEMEFPTENDFPISVSLKTTGTTPDAMRPDFITETVHDYADDFLSTSTPTTELDDVLLDPKAFGLTTTHKPLTVFGDITDSISQVAEVLRTTPAPNDFFKEYIQEMTNLDMGVFSVAMIRLFGIARDKKAKLVRNLGWGLGRLIESYNGRNRLDMFGQPTRHALVAVTDAIGEMHPDALKTYGTTLYNVMVDRRKKFSKDFNSIIDYIDSLFIKDQKDELIESVEGLQRYDDEKRVPYTLLERFVRSIFNLFEKLQSSPQGIILKESLNRGIRNHFYPNQEFQENQRRSHNHQKVKKKTSRRAELNNRTVNAKKQNVRRNPDLKETQVFWKTKEPHLNQIQERSFTFLNKINDLYDEPLEEAALTSANSNFDSYRPRPMPEQAFTALNYHHDTVNQELPQKHDLTGNNNNDNVQRPLPEQGINRDDVQKFIQRQAVSAMDKIMTDIASANKGNVFQEVKSTNPVPQRVPMTATRTTRPNLDDNKRLVSINKRDTASSKDRVLKLSSGKKHHKHRHSHKQMKHKLAKILRIIKQYKPKNKKSKHKKHHHKHRKHKSNFRSHTNEIVNKEKLNAESNRHNQDVFRDIINNNGDPAHVNLNSRRNLDEHNNKYAKVHVIRQLSSESDEEIPLKVNLHKAMALTTNRIDDQSFYGNRDVMAFRDGNDRADYDVETLLKNKLYGYYSRNIDI